ncbi:MAG: hypothetical protein JWL63_896 [Rhodocyclales bacterium]|nr:hypothetical protein [Rhodocyclales bacterium]
MSRTGIGGARGVATWQGQFGLFGAILQARAGWGNATRIDELKSRLESLPNLTAEQRAAIDDRILITRLSLSDNYAGIVGGLAECAAAGAQALSMSSTTALMSATSAIPGSAGAFFNAMQNWNKASGKLREGDWNFYMGYLGVTFAYRLAGAALFVNGVAIIVEWLIKRAALQVGLKVATVVTFCATKLNWVGWAVTIVAFLLEGAVNWFDRTKLEAWVENCYFGDEPKWKTLNTGRTLETNAWEAALQDARDQAMAQEKLT